MKNCFNHSFSLGKSEFSPMLLTAGWQNQTEITLNSNAANYRDPKSDPGVYS